MKKSKSVNKIKVHSETPLVYSNDNIGKQVLELKNNLNNLIYENFLLKNSENFLVNIHNTQADIINSNIPNSLATLENTVKKILEDVQNENESIKNKIIELNEELNKACDQIVNINDDDNLVEHENQIFSLTNRLIEKETYISYLEALLSDNVECQSIDGVNYYDCFDEIPFTKIEETIESELNKKSKEHAKIAKNANSLLKEINDIKESLNTIEKIKSSELISKEDSTIENTKIETYQSDKIAAMKNKIIDKCCNQKAKDSIEDKSQNQNKNKLSKEEKLINEIAEYEKYIRDIDSQIVQSVRIKEDSEKEIERCNRDLSYKLELLVKEENAALNNRNKNNINKINIV